MSAEIVAVSLTVAAIVISVYNTILFNRQSKLVEKQALLQRSQVYPFVKVKKVIFEQNLISLTLENMSETPAFELGLLVYFYPCTKLENGNYNLLFSIGNTNSQISKKIYFRPTVIPLKSKNGSNKLFRNETGIFNVEPSFFFTNTTNSFHKFQSGNEFGSWCLDELKEILLAQNIGYIAVEFKLVYKDVAETLQEYEPLGKFVIDLKKHLNLEQAKKDNIHFKDGTIDIKDMPMDFDVYHDYKGYRSSLNWPR